ncbi:MAG: gamma-glutamyl-gamma-aminobutyrate hydrolase family protein, partial [Prevotella sp.]|nr:gamma-glutamyl-gamma-aminobutyrate hydrolase family protein [Prevotella sp.]
MESYDLQSHLDDIYATYPEADRQPVIGITGNYDDQNAKLCDRYYKAVIEAGGTPVIIPPVNDKNVIINTLEHIDGLLLSGGGDINPLWVDEEPSTLLHSINAERDLPELLTVHLAYNRQIPILGICRGIQTLVGALGGKIRQDISDTAGLIKHSQDAERYEATHSVNILPDTILSKIYDKNKIFVNSFHHQAIGLSGDKFKVSAKSSDGVIEAIESTEYKSMMGVQWHPEWLENGKPLFKWLIREAESYRDAKDIHSQVLTLDTHCDTPMFFPQGIKFD